MSPESQRRAWAQEMLARAKGPLPEYGSPAWLALPDGSPEKVAAVVRSAEREAIGVEMDAVQRDAELAAAAAQHKAAEDSAYVARRDAHRVMWDARNGHRRRQEETAAEVESEWQDWVRGDVA